MSDLPDSTNRSEDEDFPSDIVDPITKQIARDYLGPPLAITPESLLQEVESLRQSTVEDATAISVVYLGLDIVHRLWNAMRFQKGSVPKQPELQHCSLHQAAEDLVTTGERLHDLQRALDTVVDWCIARGAKPQPIPTATSTSTYLQPGEPQSVINALNTRSLVDIALCIDELLIRPENMAAVRELVESYLVERIEETVDVIPFPYHPDEPDPRIEGDDGLTPVQVAVAMSALHDVYCPGVEKVIKTPDDLPPIEDEDLPGNEGLLRIWKRALIWKATLDRVRNLGDYSRHWFTLQLRRFERSLSPEGINSQAADRKFMEMAIEEARKSVGEDTRAHPKVGAVVVKGGRVLASAYRGELERGDHAEYTALEKKLPDATVAGATVYTTLEPCTTRNHPKIPCARRLIERKVERVVIGMLDPNPAICGKGERLLREYGIVVDRFPHDLIVQLEELNRDFTRAQSQFVLQRPEKPQTDSGK